LENSKKIVFRINLGKKTGLGHLIRCLRFSHEIIKKKYEIFFILDNLHNINLKNKKIKSIELYNRKKFVSEVEDAKKSLVFIKKIKPVAVIVDDYRLSEKWHRSIKKFTKKIIVIDDLANRNMQCNIYINYKVTNIGKLKNTVRKICNKNAKLLLGPKYLILDQHLKKTKKTKKFQILINFGNSFDFLKIKNFLAELCVKLSQMNNIKILIVIGTLAKNFKYIYKLKKNYYNVRLIEKKIFIEKYINSTQLFIGSAGNSIYEMSYLNIPSIFFSLNENQENDIHNLEKLGHFFSLTSKDLSNNKLSSFVLTMLKNYSRIKKLNKTKKIFLNKKSLKHLAANLNLK